MKYKSLATAGAALAAIILAACSSARTPTESAACATPSNYPGLCGTGSPAAAPQAAASTGPGDVPVMLTVRLGQPFELSYTENNVPAQWQVTLDSMTCGGPEIFSRKVLAAYYSDEGQPTAIPQPNQGQKFCLVKFSVTNDGQSDQPWSANDATVNVGMDAYSDQVDSPGSDAEQAYMQNAQPHDETSDFGINPGVNAVSWAVFEIPARDQPTSVSIPDGTAMNEIGGVEQVLVELT